ncbi:MAG TPA: hypothetical protein VKR23_07195 [Gaiellaceae bacterium]|nr:hypothetical protein [Gaiellaceae bacterium]
MAVLSVAGAAFAAHVTANKQASSIVIKTATIKGLGTIIVNSAGKTIYMFAPDKQKAVTCFKTCATIWPPIKVAAGQKIVAAGGAKQSLLGSDPDKAGGRVVTYNHWPLYLYLGDRKAGVAAGQALDLNGGYWYVLSPSGALIKVKPHAGGGGGGGVGGGGTTTSAGGGGGGTSTVGCSDDDGDGDTSAGGPDDGDGCI